MPGLLCQNTKTCIKCSAIKFTNELYKRNKTAIEKMAVLEIIGLLADYIHDKPKLRKPLSKLGAVRIPRNRAKAMVDGTEAPNTYCIIMMRTTPRKATP
eukprot:4549226-Heterocapsa_arctica.AAC.1